VVHELEEQRISVEYRSQPDAQRGRTLQGSIGATAEVPQREIIGLLATVVHIFITYTLLVVRTTMSFSRSSCDLGKYFESETGNASLPVNSNGTGKDILSQHLRENDYQICR